MENLNLQGINLNKFNLGGAIEFLWTNGWWMLTGILLIGKILGMNRLPWIVVLAPAIIYWSFMYLLFSTFISIL